MAYDEYLLADAGRRSSDGTDRRDGSLSLLDDSSTLPDGSSRFLDDSSRLPDGSSTLPDDSSDRLDDSLNRRNDRADRLEERRRIFTDGTELPGERLEFLGGCGRARRAAFVASG